MNHQVIEFLARDRIDAHMREAAGSRLAGAGRPAGKARWVGTRSDLAAGLRAIPTRGGLLFASVRARGVRA